MTIQSLDQSLLKYIFLKAGRISALSAVCKLFHERIKIESKSLYEALKGEFGENCVIHAVRSNQCEGKTDALKIDRLFIAAGSKSSPVPFEYDVKALREYMQPFVIADNYTKLWEAMLRSAPASVKALMGKVVFNQDILANAELVKKFIKENCAEIKKVDVLNLHSQKLKSLPPEIGYFTGLSKLDISYNFLTELPEEIGSLTKLTEFRATHNALKALPKSIGQWKLMANFQCACNQLSSFPHEICSMTELRSLNLSKNRVEKLPDEIGNLKSLNYLYLESCGLSSLPESIANSQHLIGLYLFNNQLPLLPDSLSKLQHLKYFSIQNNCLKGLPENFGAFRSLQSLFVDDNQLIEIPLSICTLSKLKQLSISNNQLTWLPEAMKGLNQLVYFNYAGNPIDVFPRGIENLPFWSLDPNLYPRLINGTEQTLLNMAMTPVEFARTYEGLGVNKWKEGIDGVHHEFGPEVYDLGLHKKYAEPGFLKGIKQAFQFLSTNMNKVVSPEFYLLLHKAACGHFKGKATNTLMGKEKVGVFRNSEDTITATFGEPDYLMTQCAINEFNELNGELTLIFGSSFRIGDLILKSKSPRKVTIYYHQLSEEQVSIVFNYFLTQFFYDIGHAQNEEAKIRSIAKFIKRLEWLHAVRDGCGRTDTAFLNYLLSIYGFNPVLLKFPYITSCNGLNEVVPMLIAGMQEWKKEKSGS